MEQQTQEWFDARMGNITASQVHNVLSKSDSKTYQNYINMKIAERLGAKHEIGFSTALEHGNFYEAEARDLYEINTGNLVTEVGYFESVEVEHCGCSPDGIVEELKKGIEIKCPYNPSNHVDYLLMQEQSDLKKLKPEYYSQIQFSMWVLGFDSFDFISYHPSFTPVTQLKVLEIKRDEEHIQRLKEKSIEALEEIKNKLNLIK